MARYNHAVTLPFTIISNDPDGLDFTPQALRAALFARIAAIELTGEWMEAVDPPFDTRPIDEAAA